ncbi:MAG TPA: hypothetical protein VMC02_11665, partial [Steroidobacteraceae bacterium]|nr:hypothetical protein [Steroidobacteraceae bacterium]
MTLTAADVAEIMRLVEQSGFDELDLEIGGTKISLRRGAAAQAPVVRTAPPVSADAVAVAPQAGRAAAPAAHDPGIQDLPAP